MEFFILIRFRSCGDLLVVFPLVLVCGVLAVLSGVLNVIDPFRDLRDLLGGDVVFFRQVVVLSNAPHVFGGQRLISVPVLAHFTLEDLRCLRTDGLK